MNQKHICDTDSTRTAVVYVSLDTCGNDRARWTPSCVCVCVCVCECVLLANLSIVNCFTCLVLVINHMQLVLCRVNQVLLYCQLTM